MWCNVGKKAGHEIPKHLASRPEDHDIITTAIKSSNIRDLPTVIFSSIKMSKLDTCILNAIKI